jgi:CubicO group peptidase (beta-lactamase class C family)
MNKQYAHILLFVIIFALSSSCTFTKIIWYNFSGIDDYKIFDNRTLHYSPLPFCFIKQNDEQLINKLIKSELSGVDFDSLLKTNNTTAFLIIKNDTIFYENYWEGYDNFTISLSFSMAKSFLSILIGCAIDDGYIKSVEQPVTDYIPELKRNGYEKVKLKHLLQMTSGMDYTESDNPFGIHTAFYYGDNLEEKLITLGLKGEPGKEYEYKSGDAQLLGLILRRALAGKTITDYMKERVWDPIGMEYNGLWSIDSKETGFEKVFCCISACAIDFAKFGRLYLNKGDWNGKQIVSKSWVEQSTQIDTTEGSAWYYQYLWWIISKERKDFAAIGHLGQYLYINSDQKIIIVRLGTDTGDLTWEEWMNLFSTISEMRLL